jgi:hypothetical protein
VTLNRSFGAGAAAVSGGVVFKRMAMKRLARRKQAARAAAAAKKPVLVKAEPAVQETARVPVPQKIARWLEKNRLFGT